MLWIVAGVVVLLLVASRPVFAAKPGTVLSTKPEINYARSVVARVWRAHNYTVTVTSGYDGTHSAQSKHYQGLAEDYRTRDIPRQELYGMVADVRAILGRDYDVVIESDHLHIEYDPKA